MEAGMDWQKEMDELRRREELAEELGGLERVRRQHDGGRYTIRERIAKLVDPGTFHELGKIAGRAVYDEKNDLTRFTPSNFVFGRATVDGRPVVVGGDDFTVRGGSADATIKGKHNMCERMAHDLRLPLIRLVEGSGGGGSVKTIETTGRANVPAVDGWEWVVANMGTIPRVALGLGSVAGLGAAHLAAAGRLRAPRALALRGDPARRPEAVQDARHRRSARGQGFVLRDLPALRRRDRHRPRPPGRLARGADGERPVLLRGRLDGGHLSEGRALRGSRADLPPAGRLSRRLPRLFDRQGRRADRHHQAGRPRDVRDLADHGPVVRRDRAQRLRGRRRRPPERQPLLHALRVAVGAVGLAPARRRGRGGVPRRTRSTHRSPGSSASRRTPTTSSSPSLAASPGGCARGAMSSSAW